jgi:hypothetical protein
MNKTSREEQLASTIRITAKTLFCLVALLFAFSWGQSASSDSSAVSCANALFTEGRSDPYLVRGLTDDEVFRSLIRARDTYGAVERYKVHWARSYPFGGSTSLEIGSTRKGRQYFEYLTWNHGRFTGYGMGFSADNIVLSSLQEEVRH